MSGFVCESSDPEESASQLNVLFICYINSVPGLVEVCSDVSVEVSAGQLFPGANNFSGDENGRVFSKHVTVSRVTVGLRVLLENLCKISIIGCLPVELLFFDSLRKRHSSYLTVILAVEGSKCNDGD